MPRINSGTDSHEMLKFGALAFHSLVGHSFVKYPGCVIDGRMSVLYAPSLLSNRHSRAVAEPIAFLVRQTKSHIIIVTVR